MATRRNVSQLKEASELPNNAKLLILPPATDDDPNPDPQTIPSGLLPSGPGGRAIDTVARAEAESALAEAQSNSNFLKTFVDRVRNAIPAWLTTNGKLPTNQLPDGVSVFPVYFEGNSRVWSDRVYAERALVSHNGAWYVCLLSTQGQRAAVTEPGVGTGWTRYWANIGLPDFPDAGSRDLRFLGFSGDTLVWQQVQGGTGGNTGPFAFNALSNEASVSGSATAFTGVTLADLPDVFVVEIISTNFHETQFIRKSELVAGNRQVQVGGRAPDYVTLSLSGQSIRYRGFGNAATRTTAQLFSVTGQVANAIVPIQSDWNVTDQSSLAFVRNKPDIQTIENSIQGNLSAIASADDAIEAITPSEWSTGVDAKQAVVVLDNGEPYIALEDISRAYNTDRPSASSKWLALGQTDLSTFLALPKALRTNIVGAFPTLPDAASYEDGQVCVVGPRFYRRSSPSSNTHDTIEGTIGRFHLNEGPDFMGISAVFGDLPTVGSFSHVPPAHQNAREKAIGYIGAEGTGFAGTDTHQFRVAIEKASYLAGRQAWDGTSRSTILDSDKVRLALKVGSRAEFTVEATYAGSKEDFTEDGVAYVKFFSAQVTGNDNLWMENTAARGSDDGMSLVAKVEVQDSSNVWQDVFSYTNRVPTWTPIAVIGDHGVVSLSQLAAAVVARLIPTGGEDGQTVGHVDGAPAWVNEQPELFDRRELPDPTGRPERVILVGNKWYRLAGVPEANQFIGSSGTFTNSSFVEHRGIASADDIATAQGTWTANPDNAITAFLVSDKGDVRLRILGSAYTEGRGRSVRTSDVVYVNFLSQDDDNHTWEHELPYSREVGGLVEFSVSGSEFESTLFDHLASGTTFGITIREANAQGDYLFEHEGGTLHWLQVAVGGQDPEELRELIDDLSENVANNEVIISSALELDDIPEKIGSIRVEDSPPLAWSGAAADEPFILIPNQFEFQDSETDSNAGTDTTIPLNFTVPKGMYRRTTLFGKTPGGTEIQKTVRALIQQSGHYTGINIGYGAGNPTPNVGSFIQGYNLGVASIVTSDRGEFSGSHGRVLIKKDVYYNALKRINFKRWIANGRQARASGTPIVYPPDYVEGGRYNRGDKIAFSDTGSSHTRTQWTGAPEDSGPDDYSVLRADIIVTITNGSNSIQIDAGHVRSSVMIGGEKYSEFLIPSTIIPSWALNKECDITIVLHEIDSSLQQSTSVLGRPAETFAWTAVNPFKFAVHDIVEELAKLTQRVDGITTSLHTTIESVIHHEGGFYTMVPDPTAGTSPSAFRLLRQNARTVRDVPLYTGSNTMVTFTIPFFPALYGKVGGTSNRNSVDFNAVDQRVDGHGTFGFAYYTDNLGIPADYGTVQISPLGNAVMAAFWNSLQNGKHVFGVWIKKALWDRWTSGQSAARPVEAILSDAAFRQSTVALGWDRTDDDNSVTIAGVDYIFLESAEQDSVGTVFASNGRRFNAGLQFKLVGQGNDNELWMGGRNAVVWTAHPGITAPNQGLGIPRSNDIDQILTVAALPNSPDANTLYVVTGASKGIYFGSARIAQ